jgi:hypothetical protein
MPAPKVETIARKPSRFRCQPCGRRLADAEASRREPYLVHDVARPEVSSRPRREMLALFVEVLEPGRL